MLFDNLHAYKMEHQVELLRGVRLQRIDTWDEQHDYTKTFVINDRDGSPLILNPNYRISVRIRDGSKPFEKSILLHSNKPPMLNIANQVITILIRKEFLQKFFMDDYARRLHVEVKWKDRRDGTSGVYLWLIKVASALS